MQFRSAQVDWIDIGPAYHRVSGWWQLIFFFEFSPLPTLGEMVHPIWLALIFWGLGWNHQLGMLTLFMSITGGLSWIDALEALTSFSFFALTFFVIYIVPWIFWQISEFFHEKKPAFKEAKPLHHVTMGVDVIISASSYIIYIYLPSASRWEERGRTRVTQKISCDLWLAPRWRFLWLRILHATSSCAENTRL